jgi:hypothetical protein
MKLRDGGGWPVQGARQMLLDLLPQATSAGTADREQLQQLLHLTVGGMDDDTLTGAEVLQLLRALPLPPQQNQLKLIASAYRDGELQTSVAVVQLQHHVSFHYIMTAAAHITK